MKKLNLVYKDNSDIEYKISQFPDGQQSITISGLQFNPVQIKSRLNSFKDLELIICANKALRDVGVKEVHLYVPYFLGARSDRKFIQGSPNYLKEVICPIINLQEFQSVTVIDPHSDVLEACLNNYIKVDNKELVKFALTNIDNKNDAQDRICLISPDAGAFKKIYDVAKHFKITNVVTATKMRDMVTGNILYTEVPVKLTDVGKKFVIIDDICDGGRTFIEIAKSIKVTLQTTKPKIYLIVTHGIFSAGYDTLSEYFDGVYCTNSVKDITRETMELETSNPFILKQLNVF
jgi:ribose-phosphate pyrophosphokinase